MLTTSIESIRAFAQEPHTLYSAICTQLSAVRFLLTVPAAAAAVANGTTFLSASGALCGFGFEAKPASFTLYEGNVWAAPAYGWVTDGSMNNSMPKWVENMINAAHGSFPTRVN